MLKPASTRHTLLRSIVLLTSATAAYGLTGFEAELSGLNVLMLAHFVSVYSAAALKPATLTIRARIAYLTGDLVVLGSVAYLASVPAHAELGHHSVFLAAFVISTMAAVIGRESVAALFAVLSGMLVIGLGAALLSRQGADVEWLVIAAQMLWIVIAAAEAAIITDWVDRKNAWMQLNNSVDRELKAREDEAAELKAFSHSLADAVGVHELADAVLRHLRCHLEVRARAIVIESDSDEVAVWEESGRLEHDHIERRRVAVQKALSRNGSNYVIHRLMGRSMSSRSLPEKLDFHTSVDVPIQAGGRVAGLLLLADPARGALPPHRIGILADVARQAGEALQRIERRRDLENRRTALLLRQMREGVLLLGPDGNVLLANPAAKTALAASADETGSESIGGVSLRELGKTPPGISRRFRAHIAGATEGERATELSCTAVGVMDNGKRVGTLVTITDITDEELARRQLMQAERSTLVGQTLAGVAHELNNPLAALIGYADILGAQEVPATIEKPVRRMREQAQRATRIVRNLLNFARRRNPTRSETHLGELVEATVELFAYEARMIDAELDVDIPDDAPIVLADKHALQQILVNLVQNALHALAAWNGDRKLSISLQAAGEMVALTVADTGGGVPDELRTSIFQPFFTTKGPGKGTGLGLALSASIAREHGGELILEPDTGVGARFVLRLPVRASAPETTPAIDDPLEGLMRSVPGHILVVDDEPSVRESLVTQLGNLGSRVDSARDSAEAERMINDGHYDAVLLDIRMPGASGIELHRTIAKRNPTLADKVVFMTGDFVNDDVLGRVMKTGNQLLEKPFTMDELTKALGHTPKPPPSHPYTITS